jgi:NAD(P) transhydrogenase subunit beta
VTPLAALLDDSLEARTLLAHLGYLASVVMFMLALIRMSRVKTAGGANTLAASAMALAVVSQLVELGSFDPTWLAAGFVAGGLVGALLASRVSMTGMPELVALLNGFGGFASTLVGIGTWFHWTERHAAGSGPLSDAFTGVNLMLTIVLGNLTFTGSLVAYLKLSEKMPTRPLLFPGRNAVNLLLFLASLGLSVAAAVAFTNGDDAAAIVWLVTGVTLVLGATLVFPIGGGDMPVVISLHDSFAGFAGALAGFAIGSPVLIVAGTIVGAAGLILTRIMCKSMNRGMWNVVLGGFGAVTEQGGGGGGYGTVRSADAEEAGMVLADARTCIIVPGYGMAVAQAQHAVRELGDLLEKRGCTVRYAVHPVAGRMPGHMNVLLAEANVSYDKLFEMDAIDSDFKNTDVAIVIGANDVVNPAAKTNKQSPLYGMPVLSVDEAKTVFVIKRSLGAGFAGVKNELFERENTRMIYADGKKAVEDIGKALKDA